MADSRTSPLAGRSSVRRCVTAAAALGVAVTVTGAAPAHRAWTDAGPFPVPVAVDRAEQAITVKASGTHATVTLWARQDGAWRVLASTTEARIGSGGLHDGRTRVQGTGTTPTGTYTITQAFGIAPDPGTRMPYHHVTTHDWWVQDPSSVHYNRMRTDTEGGFHLTEEGILGSEHLINYPGQYDNVLVIDFNSSPVVRGRGAGIFLHDLSPQADPTAGCVAVPAAFMSRTMRWIDPAEHPVIAIG
ncbi:L,D-transpeptidase family protein [Kitasatospora sp. NPDC090091]|uniref:L,D-transpeptidase family protein n=1 Tax=Kitasatospora sp. NPDC090091 TaxID=3364081 RepID=UPI0037F48597